MINRKPKEIKAVLFDMDGVLYNSMKHHADTWTDAFKQYNIEFPPEEAYLNEGRTGDATIKKAVRELANREAKKEEIEGIYREKTARMAHVPQAHIIPGMQELMTKLRQSDLKIIVVTGSRQQTLLDRLNKDFGVAPEEVVSGWDVKIGKPHPEPYLIGLEKAGCTAEEALVIENSPLGIESAVKAGIFTIAINTGPLKNEILTEAGAAKVVESTEEIHTLFMPGRER